MEIQCERCAMIGKLKRELEFVAFFFLTMLRAQNKNLNAISIHEYIRTQCYQCITVPGIQEKATPLLFILKVEWAFFFSSLKLLCNKMFYICKLPFFGPIAHIT